MPPLLLIDPHQTAAVQARRTRRPERVRARLWPWRLDVALAEIRHVLRDAARPRHRFERQLHPCAPEVFDVAPLLHDLAAELAHPAPVDARGVAQVRLLLRDGTGPLCDEPWAGRLECCLTQALSALAPRQSHC
jgi:hypothetical protein